jgi:hypothetical protein
MEMSKKITKAEVASVISRSLVEFGYPDCTPEKMTEVIDAYLSGRCGHDLPHDILGNFAERQLDDLAENGIDLGLLR